MWCQHFIKYPQYPTKLVLLYFWRCEIYRFDDCHLDTLHVAGIRVQELLAEDRLDDDLVLDLVGEIALVLDEVMDLDDALAVATHLGVFVKVVDDGRDPFVTVTYQCVFTLVYSQHVQIVRRSQHANHELFLGNQLHLPPNHTETFIGSVNQSVKMEIFNLQSQTRGNCIGLWCGFLSC